jgi:hypothetical protein
LGVGKTHPQSANRGDGEHPHFVPFSSHTASSSHTFLVPTRLLQWRQTFVYNASKKPSAI